MIASLWARLTEPMGWRSRKGDVRNQLHVLYFLLLHPPDFSCGLWELRSFGRAGTHRTRDVRFSTQTAPKETGGARSALSKLPRTRGGARIGFHWTEGSRPQRPYVDHRKRTLLPWVHRTSITDNAEAFVRPRGWRLTRLC